MVTRFNSKVISTLLQVICVFLHQVSRWDSMHQSKTAVNSPQPAPASVNTINDRGAPASVNTINHRGWLTDWWWHSNYLSLTKEWQKSGTLRSGMRYTICLTFVNSRNLARPALYCIARSDICSPLILVCYWMEINTCTIVTDVPLFPVRNVLNEDFKWSTL